LGAIVVGGAAPQVEGSGTDEILTESVGGQGRLDHQISVFGVRVASVVPVNLEFPVSAAGHGDLMLPQFVIQCVEVVLEDELSGRVSPLLPSEGTCCDRLFVGSLGQGEAE